MAVSYPTTLPPPQFSGFVNSQDQNFFYTGMEYGGKRRTKPIGTFEAKLKFKYTEVQLNTFTEWYYNQLNFGVLNFEATWKIAGFSSLFEFGFTEKGQPQFKTTKPLVYEATITVEIVTDIFTLFDTNYTGTPLTTQYPDILPRPLFKGFGVTNPQTYYHSAFEYGNKRRYSPVGNITAKMTFLLSESELQIFNHWYYAKLVLGASNFRATWNINGLVADLEYGFIKKRQPEFKPIAEDKWEVKIGVEIISDYATMQINNNYDGYCPEIIDCQTELLLFSRDPYDTGLIVNGTFDTDLNGWDYNPLTWEQSNGQAVRIEFAATNTMFQNFEVEIFTEHIIVFYSTILSGSDFKVRLITEIGGNILVDDVISTNGRHEILFTSTDKTNVRLHFAKNLLGVTFSVDNISVKKT